MGMSRDKRQRAKPSCICFLMHQRSNYILTHFSLMVCFAVLFGFTTVLETDPWTSHIFIHMTHHRTTSPAASLPRLVCLVFLFFFPLWWCWRLNPEHVRWGTFPAASSPDLNLWPLKLHESILPCPLNFHEALTLSINDFWYSKWYKTIWVGQLNLWTEKQ